MNVSPIIKYRTLAIAKALAPHDTGNLRHNAISLKRVKPSSWTVRYSVRHANYIEPLQEGWVNRRTGEIHTPHKGFIDRTVLVVASYVYNELMGNKQNTGRFLREALSTSKNTLQREMVNSRSRMGYSDYKELTKNKPNKDLNYTTEAL